MKLRSSIKYILTGLLALLLIVTLLTSWLVATESGLKWIGKRALSFAPELSIGEMKGRLIGPLSIENLRYKNQELELSVEKTTLNWQPSKLLVSTATINYLTVSEVDIKQIAEPLPKIEDNTPPPTLEEIINQLRLPISILIEKLDVKNLSYDGSYYKRKNNNEGLSEAFTLESFLLKAKSDSQKIKIDTLRIESNVAKLNGSVTLGLASSQDTSGKFNWTVFPEKSTNIATVNGKTQLSGNTKELKIENEIEAPYSTLLTININNLIRKPSALSTLNFNKVSINKINPDWPSYQLDGNIELKGDIDKANLNSQLMIITGEGKQRNAVNNNIKTTPIEKNNTAVTIDTQGRWEDQALKVNIIAKAPSIVESINIDSLIKPALLNTQAKDAISLTLAWQDYNKPTTAVNSKQASSSRSSNRNESRPSESTVFSPSGQLHLSGNLKQYQFKLNALFEAITSSNNTNINTITKDQKGQLIVNGNGTTEAVTLNKITLTGPMGSLDGQGDVKIQPPIAANLQLSGKKLNPSFLSPQWPGQLNLNVDVKTNINQGQAVISAIIDSQGTLRDYPFSLKADGRYADDAIALKTIALKSGSSTINASARVNKNKMLSAEWNINSRQLEELVPDLQGVLTSKGEIESMPTVFKQTPKKNGLVSNKKASTITPKVIATIEGSSIAIANNQIDSVKANIDIDWRPKSSNTNNLTNSLAKNVINIRANKISTDAITISSASLDMEGKPEKHNMAADINTDKGDIELSLFGSLLDLANKPEWVFTLNSATLAPEGLSSFTLDKSTEGKVSALEQKINQHCWSTAVDGKIIETSEKAKLCLEGSHNNGLIKSDFAIQQFPTEYIASLLPEGLSWTTTVIDGGGNINITPSNDMDVNVDLSISPGELNWVSSSNEGNKQDDSKEKNERTTTTQTLQLEAGQLLINSNQNTLTASLTLPIEKQTGLKGNISITNTKSDFIDRPLKGTLQLELHKLSPLVSFIPDASELKGKLDSEWRIGGSIKEPWLDGELTLRDGQVRLNSPGIFLDDISLALKGTQQSGINYTASATSAGGALEAKGKVLLKEKGPELELEIEGNNFQVLNTEEAIVYASPKLTITSRNQLTHIEGSVTIPEASITPKKLPPSVVSPSEDQIIVNESGEPDTVAAEQNLSTDIRLILGSKVLVDGFGFKGKTSGSLRVTKAVQGPTLGNGKIRILEGEYRAFGQGLVIDKGEILFADGPISKPGIDIKAVRRPAEGITVGVLARGSVAQPDLTIFSEPSMTQTEQLSWLVLGRPPEQSSDGENNAISQLLLSFTLSKGDSYLNNVKDTFKLDTLNIKTGSGEAGAASDTDLAELVLGKYLSPDLYVSYGIGLFKPVNVLSLEYSLGKRWKLKSETSSESSGGDLVYTIER